MIRAIVVDDEWYNLEEIADLVDGTGLIKVVKKYQNPIEALEEAEEYKPELAFLDIEMPEIDGIKLAGLLYKACPGIRVVFITSWNRYAVQAFDLNAIDYILKPIKKERFYHMVEKLEHEFKVKRNVYAKRIKIRCFEVLEASIGEMPVKWERAKAEELFAYLLMNHDCYIHKERIIEELWTDYEPIKALRILQTVVCRIRNIFSQMSEEILLDYSGNKYCLRLKAVDCDLIELESALGKYRHEDESTYENIENALSIYKSGFLSQQGYLWSMEKDEKLRKSFMQILQEIAEKYRMENKNEELCRYLKLLSVLKPYDRELNYSLLKMWKDNGEDYKAGQHYVWLADVLKKEYDTVIPKEIEELFG